MGSVVPYCNRFITVYETIGTLMRKCDLGAEHSVKIYTQKRLGPVISVRPYSNGYETLDTDLRRDRQGRVYHQHVQIDYFNNISWWRDNDNVMFTPQHPHSLRSPALLVTTLTIEELSSERMTWATKAAHAIFKRGLRA